MTSEMEKILKGKVVSTAEYESSKKTIGVSTKNLIANENGIVPLGKQGAFEQVETIDFADAISGVQNQPADIIEETLDLPILDDSPLENNIDVQKTTEILEEKPIQVENPNRLSEFQIPNIEATEINEKQEEIEKKPLDIELPTMPEAIVADEPSVLDNNLFEQDNKPLEMQTTNDHETELSKNEIEEESKNNQTVSEEYNLEPGDIDIPSIDIDIPIVEENNDINEKITEKIVHNEDLHVAAEKNMEKNLEELETKPLPQTNETKEMDVSNIIEKHREIIMNCATSISNICDELTKAAKELEELAIQAKKPQASMPELPKNMEMIQQSHNLVDDALDRINLMGGPRM